MMLPPSEGDPVPRAECYRCLRPASLCLCPLIPRVPNRTGLWILQHQREQRHPVGTVRLAELAFEQVEVAVYRPDGQHPPAVQAVLSPGTALLYPNSDAPELASLPPSLRPTRLVVPDGTWAQVRVLLGRFPALARLPQVRLAPLTPGRYQVRREPRPECLSTIEAILGALRILEPETPGLDALEQAFWALVQGQAQRAKAGQRRHLTRLPKERPHGGAIPSIFATSPERLVVACGELSSRPAQGDPKSRQAGVLWSLEDTGATDSQPVELLRGMEVQSRLEVPSRMELPSSVVVLNGVELPSRVDVPNGVKLPNRVEVLEWCARRLGSEDRFHAIVRPSGALPSDKMLRHTGLSREDLAGGITQEAFLQAWSRFIRPGDQVAVWSAANRDSFGAALRGKAPGADLIMKTAYCNARHRRAGTLDDLLERERLSSEPEPCIGRAGPLLGQLLALARLLGNLAAR